MTKPEKTLSPSKLELTTFCLFRSQGWGQSRTAEAGSGAVAARISDSGKIQLLAGSVPFNSAVFAERAPAPGSGLLMLYGIRDTLDELQRWRAIARERGMSFAQAKITVEVGYIEVGLTDRTTLRKFSTVAEPRLWPSRFLNVRRMTAGLQSEVLHRFSKYVEEAKESVDINMARVSQIATRPDLFERLFKDDIDFQANLDILVIPVADSPDGRIRQLAFVRPGAKIVSIEQGSDEAEIILPAWMNDDSAEKSTV
jgi:hypothetical protein